MLTTRILKTSRRRDEPISQAHTWDIDVSLRSTALLLPSTATPPRHGAEVPSSDGAGVVSHRRYTALSSVSEDQLELVIYTPQRRMDQHPILYFVTFRSLLQTWAQQT
jgi:hypothetical protein